ncbi:MAG: hypothetical protein J5I65_07105 [Aridibacter famidurans]|nr:hypothetical protein [Aridibacter famidurans]
MDLDKLVKERLVPEVSDLGFWLAYEGKDCVRLENGRLILIVLHSQMDGTTYGSLRRKGGQDNSLDFRVFQEYFGCSLPPERTPEVFIETLIKAFGTELGQDVINGNLAEFERYSRDAATRYTAEIERQLWSRRASDAWERRDFVRFLEIIEQVDENDLSKSQLAKMRIAKEQVS